LLVSEQASEQIERRLRRARADLVAIAGKESLERSSLGAGARCQPHGPDRLLRRAAGGAGDTGYREGGIYRELPLYAFCHRADDLFRDRAILIEQLGRNVEEIGDRSYHTFHAGTTLFTASLEDRADPGVVSLSNALELEGEWADVRDPEILARLNQL